MINESKFVSLIDISEIPDSMLLDSDQEICRYEDGRYSVTVEVRGEVNVDWCPEGISSGNACDTYRYPSEFPKELKELIRSNPYWFDTDDRVYVDANNWFELFIWNKEDGKEVYLTSDVVDVENCSSEKLEELCKESLRIYLEDI